MAFPRKNHCLYLKGISISACSYESIVAKTHSNKKFEVGEVTLSQGLALSVDLTMVPLSPTATKTLFPKSLHRGYL
ncbi:MAG: hypothetical protein Ct9H300mP28_37960 [Pseudomonadota bacterium]|nr:MAG: hypothetical protein Ct9H300mP28_37960 [Pseudomonadota bacterium]